MMLTNIGELGAVISGAKMAVTLCVSLIVKTQIPTPLQAPVQPAKMLPCVGIAERVTNAFGVKSAAHVMPQLIPPTLEVTLPLPLPVTNT